MAHLTCNQSQLEYFEVNPVLRERLSHKALITQCTIEESISVTQTYTCVDYMLQISQFLVTSLKNEY